MFVTPLASLANNDGRHLAVFPKKCRLIVCASIVREETPTSAALVGTVAEEVGWIDARCPGSSRFRERLAKGKDQFLEFGFGYLFRSTRPWKPLRHALVHFRRIFALASDPHWKNVNPAQEHGSILETLPIMKRAELLLLNFPEETSLF